MRSGALLTLLAAGCGGVSHHLREGVEPPRSIAVLPFGGRAAPELRDAARVLWQSRLQSRGFLVPEAAWVDRVLTERGWLRDPATFDTAPIPVAEACRALAVDAIAVGQGVDESRFNFVLLRRHAISAELAIRTADDRPFWSANHTAGSFGGFLLKSGQVFNELQAQGTHGTPMASLALVDELIADVAETLPARAPAPAPSGLPAVASAAISTSTRADGTQRIAFEVTATPNAEVRADLFPHARGVPLVAVASEPTRYRGAFDLATTEGLERIVVHARDAFGREVQAEVER